MKTLVQNQSWNITADSTTCGDGGWEPRPWPELAVWALRGTTPFSTLDEAFNDSCLWASGTGFGCTIRAQGAPAVELLPDIRRRTGLTWDQLARIFGVRRRSLHLWVKGSRMSADNAERLEQVAAVARFLDVGDPDRTRSALLRPRAGGESIFDLLYSGRHHEALALARRPMADNVRRDRPAKRPPALSRNVRQGRRGLPPLELLTGAADLPQPLGVYLGVSPIPRQA